MTGRTLVAAVLLLIAGVPGIQLHAQVQGTLHVTISLLDAEQRSVPVPKHALLISDNPATSSPRRVVTGSDGKVDVRLRPGNYTVESDEPVAFGGRGYEWTIDVDVPANGEATVVLNAANAGIGDAPAVGPGVAPRLSSPSMALQQWKPSVVALWTPTGRSSGFLFDARGLVATSASQLAGVQAVDVQVSAEVKVRGQVVVADATKDLAVIRVAPEAVAGVTPLLVSCPGSPNVVEGDELFALGVPMRPQQDTLSSGEVKRIASDHVEADLRLPPGVVGGPVFSETSELVGLTSLPAETDERRRLFSVVPVSRLCDMRTAVDAALPSGTVPSAARLPVDTGAPAAADALKEAASKRAGDLSAYQAESSDFDIAFITPVMTYAAQHPPADRRTTSKDTHRTLEEEVRASREMDFGAWSEYVAEVPPVLLVRVTPKMAEGFWRGLARGAAMTQGIQLPPMKSAKAVFSRMQAYCGADEVAPIHTFLIETPTSDKDTFKEALYAFAPDALGSKCGSAKLVLYSEKEPQKGDSRQVAAAILTRIDQDMALLQQK